MKDLKNKRLVKAMAPEYQMIFDVLKDIENLKMTQTRADTLSEKRRDKGQLINPTPRLDDWAGPDAPPFTDEERIASISDPDVHSGSREQLYASFEQESQQLGNLFCYQTLRWLYPDDGAELDWVSIRAEKPVLQWRHRSDPTLTCLPGITC
jgi:hypothetical protein